MKVFEASEFMNGAVGFLIYTNQQQQQQQRENRMERNDGVFFNELRTKPLIHRLQKEMMAEILTFLPRLENVSCLLLSELCSVCNRMWSDYTAVMCVCVSV